MAWARVCRGRFALCGHLHLVALLLMVLPAKGAWAADDTSVRTARLAYFEGDVTILRADNTGGDAAQLNMPLTEGIRVATGGNGQAEIEFEDGSLVRLSPQSSVLLSRLGIGGDGNFDTQVDVLGGLVYAELRATPRYTYRVEAGDDTVTPLANATVRITLDQPPVEVAVLDGTVHVEQAGGGYRVDVGRGEALRGDAGGGGRYFLSQRIEHNSWDDWNEERDQAAADALTARTSARDGYAGDEGYGWSDLDANGTWFDRGQGPVWQPFDASVSGFDPYGYGSWVYTTGPGYVWSSGFAWGWTPFRCGSWNYWQDFGWGWIPAGGCGAGGFGIDYGGGGFGGGGGRRVNRINLSNVPPGYKRPLPPVVGGPVRVHPIIPIRTGTGPTGDRVRAFEARQIAGKTALPLRTLGSGYTARGGSAVGASLRRDFPVDRETRQPVMGNLTVPAGRGAIDAARRTAEPGVGSTGAGNPAAFGTTGSREVRTGPGSIRAARGVGAVRPAYPSRGVPLAGENRTSTPAASGAPRSTYGSSAISPSLGSSVASPPPGDRVRVHPGDQVGDGGHRVAPGGEIRPVPVLSSPPAGMRPMPPSPSPQAARPMPTVSASAPVRSAPAAPAAAPAAPAASPKK